MEYLARRSGLWERAGSSLDPIVDPFEAEAAGLEPNLIQCCQSEFDGNLVGADALHWTLQGRGDRGEAASSRMAPGPPREIGGPTADYPAILLENSRGKGEDPER